MEFLLLPYRTSSANLAFRVVDVYLFMIITGLVAKVRLPVRLTSEIRTAWVIKRIIFWTIDIKHNNTQCAIDQHLA